MIWGLEFEKYWESKEFHTDAHSALLSVYDIFRRRDLPCFLLYRYKLPNLEYDWVNPKTIKTKFGVNHPSKIDFSKIYSKWVILYHIDVFEKDPDRLRDFFQYCKDNDIDVIMPVKTGFKSYFNSELWEEVEVIINEFDHHIIPIKELTDEFRFQRMIERELKLNDLFN